MSEAAALAWLLKVEEAEGHLLHKQSELASQLERQRLLEGQLRSQTQEQLRLRIDLLRSQEHLARARRKALTSEQEAEHLQENLDGSSLIAMGRQCQHAVQGEVRLIQDLVGQELSRMKLWQEVCQDVEGPLAEHVHGRNKVVELRERIKQVCDVSMPSLRVQLDCTELEQQLKQLQAELSQVEGRCASLATQCSSQEMQMSKVQEQIAAVERRLQAVRDAERISMFERKLHDARMEQGSLQAQLEAMETWLHNLKNGPHSNT